MPEFVEFQSMGILVPYGITFDAVGVFGLAFHLLFKPCSTYCGVKGLVICFYLGWSGSILQFRQNIIKVGLKSWLHTCSSNITLSLPSYTGSALKRELNFCNGYLSLLYFWYQS